MKEAIKNVKDLHIKLCIKAELKDLKQKVNSAYDLIRTFQLRIEKIEKHMPEED